jgi:hypothetical protein
VPIFRRNRQRDVILSPVDEAGRLRVQCWYCGQEIDYEGPDPCAVIFVTNWAEPTKQREQQFFAHAECFRKSGSGTDLYVLDDDFDGS